MEIGGVTPVIFHLNSSVPPVCLILEHHCFHRVLIVYLEEIRG
jgi:hypothetical protein